jgi:hypothetical protein
VHRHTVRHLRRSTVLTQGGMGGNSGYESSQPGMMQQQPQQQQMGGAGVAGAMMPSGGQQGGMMTQGGQERGMMTQPGQQGGMMPQGGQQSGMMTQPGQQGGMMPQSGQQSGMMGASFPGCACAFASRYFCLQPAPAQPQPLSCEELPEGPVVPQYMVSRNSQRLEAQTAHAYRRRLR